MLSKIFSPNPFKIFYLVFAYILAFALWWAYLLYDKNETAYKEKVELNSIAFTNLHPQQDYTSTAGYLQIHSKYLRQKTMIIGEGSVFISLLLFGLMMVRRVFRKEIELANQQSNFLLSITHELKSPMSTIKLSLQTMGKRRLETEQTEKLINNSLADLDRLESLVDNILFAAKIERNEPGFLNEEINISAVVMHAVERFAHNKKAIQIRADITPGIYLAADALGFTSVINNLIENAVKYSESNTSVDVKLNADAQNVYLTIADRGIGIAADEKEKIFRKFYRVGNEDTRRTSGTGLGLYIVKRFAEIYKGKITVEDNQPRGSIFKITFPQKPGS
jgi:two-component system, OmpR family, phosphate regulon sensor histidine kinase PhoR